jgi:hypothetical protein
MVEVVSDWEKAGNSPSGVNRKGEREQTVDEASK